MVKRTQQAITLTCHPRTLACTCTKFSQIEILMILSASNHKKIGAYKSI